MRKIEKNDIEFLKELGKEMREQDTDSQASPRFWTLRDYEWQETTSGYHDRVVIYLPWDQDTYGVAEAVERILEGEIELSDEQLDELRSMDSSDDNARDIVEWMNENVSYLINLRYEEKIAFVVPNTFFLTKREAKEHIKNNYYHYTEEVHTYGMTAWRAPQVERLFEILEEVEWE